jgi:Zn-dependent M32 family carboxypeptidase
MIWTYKRSSYLPDRIHRVKHAEKEDTNLQCIPLDIIVTEARAIDCLHKVITQMNKNIAKHPYMQKVLAALLTYETFVIKVFSDLQAIYLGLLNTEHESQSINGLNAWFESMKQSLQPSIIATLCIHKDEILLQNDQDIAAAMLRMGDLYTNLIKKYSEKYIIAKLIDPIKYHSLG